MISTVIWFMNKRIWMINFLNAKNIMFNIPTVQSRQHQRYGWQVSQSEPFQTSLHWANYLNLSSQILYWVMALLIHDWRKSSQSTISVILKGNQGVNWLQWISYNNIKCSVFFFKKWCFENSFIWVIFNLKETYESHIDLV